MPTAVVKRPGAAPRPGALRIPQGVSAVDAEAASVLKGIMCQEPRVLSKKAPLALSGHDLLDSLATVALLEPHQSVLPRPGGSLKVLNGRVDTARRPRSASDSDMFQQQAPSTVGRVSGDRSPASVAAESPGGGPCLSAVLPHMMAKYAGVYNKHGRIGIYTPDERQAILRRFHEKRLRRVWTKKIRYNCRKSLADKRIRVKGRFVKKEELEAMLAAEGISDGASTAESDSGSEAGADRKRSRSDSVSSTGSAAAGPAPKSRRVKPDLPLAPQKASKGGPTEIHLAPRIKIQVPAQKQRQPKPQASEEPSRARFRRHSIAF